MTDAAARNPTDTEAGLEGAGLRVSVSEQGGGGDAPPRLLTPPARRRLVNVLLAKAAVDLLFVCALAAGFHYAAFRPSLRGSLDHADAASVRGWVVDRSEPARQVEVQLYLNGRFVAAGVAGEPRPDVAAKGFAPDPRHGFVFRLDPPLSGEYEARVYAVHPDAAQRRRTLQQIGDPLRIKAVDGSQ